MSPAEDRKTLNATASHWLNRSRSGEMSTEETRAFQVWLARKPAHRETYDRLSRLWGELAVIADDPAIIRSCERDALRFNRGGRLLVAGGVTAGAMLVAVCSWAVITSGVLAEIGVMHQPKGQELRTSVGQRTTITLKDNSIVTLDTDTRLRLRESPWERRIELERGRAFFQVAKDKARPFIVVAAGKTVRATGTQFDVRVDDAHLQVTLVEGRVRVQDQDKTKAGQSAEMRAGWRLDAANDDQWRVTPVDVSKETSWHDGRLSFFNDRLVDAVAEMNRYSERKIVFAGRPPDVAVVGVFRTGDIDSFVRALELNRLVRVASANAENIEIAER